MPRGNLHSLLHSGANVVVDTAQTIRFALQIAKGMAFLHSLERLTPEYHLNSFHVMVCILLMLKHYFFLLITSFEMNELICLMYFKYIL